MHCAPSFASSSGLLPSVPVPFLPSSRCLPLHGSLPDFPSLVPPAVSVGGSLAVGRLLAFHPGSPLAVLASPTIECLSLQSIRSTTRRAAEAAEAHLRSESSARVEAAERKAGEAEAAKNRLEGLRAAADLRAAAAAEREARGREEAAEALRKADEELRRVRKELEATEESRDAAAVEVAF